MSADEFTRLFAYMERRFNELEAKLDQKAERSDVDSISCRLDSFLGRQEDTELELASSKLQINRQESWIKKAAPKIQIPYRVQ